MQIINGVVADAPVFNKAPSDLLLKIVKLLLDASYHYADDSGKEWAIARERVNEAARIVNELKLGFAACEHLYKHTSQLVSFEQFMNAILKDLRK